MNRLLSIFNRRGNGDGVRTEAVQIDSLIDSGELVAIPHPEFGVVKKWAANCSPAELATKLSSAQAQRIMDERSS